MLFWDRPEKVVHPSEKYLTYGVPYDIVIIRKEVTGSDKGTDRKSAGQLNKIAYHLSLTSSDLGQAEQEKINSKQGGRRKPPTSLLYHFQRKMKDTLTTVLLVFIVLRIIDFSNMNVLDYAVIILAVVYAAVSIFDIGGKKR